MIASKELFLAEWRGTRMLRDLVESMDSSCIVEGKEEWERLCQGVGEEYEWDCYSDVEHYCVAEKPKLKHRYRFHMDGDLWLIPHKDSIVWVGECEEPDDYWDDPERYDGYYEWKTP